MNGTLVTFGCGWTYGTGAAWHADMSREQFETLAWTHNSTEKSFRTKLSKKFSLRNVNYSTGASSNQRNFRIARGIFSDKKVLEKAANSGTIVLWGITTTARSEYYNIHKKKYESVNFAHNDDPLYQQLVDRSYSHSAELQWLAEEMNLWNQLFDSHGVRVLWFDTYNTHHYPLNVNNLIQPDLLTSIMPLESMRKPRDKWYHKSSWEKDDPRILAGVNYGLLNPWSYHPTEYGHDKIVDLLSPKLEDLLNE